MFPDDVESLVAAVVAAFATRGWTAVTAESCTGGLVAAALTGIAGSSTVVDRGSVTYSNAAKTQMLGVPAALIQAHGAVSAQVALAMAIGARQAIDTRCAVSITGIAGPGGGSADKPVGRVHFACVGPGGTTQDVRSFGDIGRQPIRLASVRVALELLLAQTRVP